MRGKEKLIPHAARAGRWLEEQSWASALPSFYLASSQSPKGFNNNNNEFTGCVYRVRISGWYIGWYIGGKGRWRDWSWISCPDGQGSAATQRIRHAGRLRRRGGCVHSIRQEGGRCAAHYRQQYGPYDSAWSGR